MKVRIQGQIAVFSTWTPPQKSGGGKRGAVIGFSDKSRKRMIEKILKINHAIMGKPKFLTLTYPLAYPAPEETKQHLTSFWRKFQNEYGRGTVALWKLELQKRGAPHYHLLVWKSSHISKAWLSRSWFRTVKSGDPKHLLAGTKVEVVRTENGIAFYVSKYMTKLDKFSTVGRVWGVLGRKNWDEMPEVELEISKHLFDTFGEIYDKTVQERGERGLSFTLYGREVISNLLDEAGTSSNHVVS